MQSKWRENHNFPIGKSIRGNYYGNYLEEAFAYETRNNFLTENIRNLVENEIKKSKITGALIDRNRMYCNLLSSQPLCFNLFGELKYNLDIATRVLKNVF